MKQNPFKEEMLPAGLGKILVAHLIPDKKNPRKDLKKGDPEFEKISKSVEKFGQLDPIIFNTRTRKVIGGHQRLKVLDSKGYTELYTVTLGAYTWAFAEADLKELSDKEENAANIALNKAQGDWEIDQLTANLQELKLEGLLDVTGFDDKEFDAMIRELHKDDEPQDSEPQISRAEELREEWGTELGQMWQCGDHRVICGDCTELTNVKRLMQGEKADMVFTDPPYGIGYEYNEHEDKQGKEYLDWCSRWFDLIKSQSELIIITTGWKYKPFWYSKNPYDEMVWFDKGKQSGGKAFHLRKTEPIFIFGKVHNKYNWDILECLRDQEKVSLRECHTCPEPIKFLSDLIEPQTKMGDIVLDPFLGSGTTMIACENLGRKCRGCEIDPGYVAVILQRYKDTFGKEPVLLK